MALTLRPIEEKDEQAWHHLWQAYNSLYNRYPKITDEITRTNFKRFLDPNHPVRCTVAVSDSRNVIGFVKYFPHLSTASIEDVVYMQDLFVDPSSRNSGVGRALIEHVYGCADDMGLKEVYWHSQYFNHQAQLLYAKVGKRTDFVRYDRPEETYDRVEKALKSGLMEYDDCSDAKL